MHGYSSSSESDDPRRPKAAAAAAAPANDQKKKTKKKQPPQQSINRVWKRFQNRKFNKALSVLPFDPVLPPASPERANELLSAGYERAAEECRRKVKKIIQECRRVNLRYRDPGFDLDWDLKTEKGHCLNGLGQQKWQLNKSTLSNPTAAVPKAVKRVHEVYEKPTFLKNLSGGQIKQGSLGDCWFMASLTGLASVEDGIKRICVEYDTRIGIYGFVFFRDGEWIYSIIDDKLYLKSPCWDSPSMQRDLLQQIDREDVEKVYRKTYQTGSKALFFAQCRDQNETWVPLIEKAYAKAHGDYGCLSGGWIGEGLEDLSGGVTTELLSSDILDVEGFWENEISKVNEEFMFGCSTGLLEYGYGERNGISEGHAYIIMEARTLKSGERLVKLRNPWGKIRKGMWEGAWSDGSKEWTTEVQEELGHQFGSDSVFWIAYEDLLHKYQHFDRTRLFRDPEWRCCQRWIGVEVPWKPQYNEKFHIKLTKDSPLVLVLSQLDNRYFKGLQGQYNFRLHFRLHEQARSGAEDYIVRSHGNYLMDRSVSVELPDMPAGNYTVFISVTAERDLDLPSVEEAVKRECKKRVENQKLAQVGHAYDLAHSKGMAHLEEVVKLRKTNDQNKASESRKKERRRLWEKRHLNRDVTKRQTKKNTEKRQRKSVTVEAPKDVEEEHKEEVVQEQPKDQAVQTETAPAEPKEDKSVQTETQEVTDKSDKATDETKEEETDEKAEERTVDSAASSESSGSPTDTPKSEDAIVTPSTAAKESVPPVDGSPPPPPPPPAAYDSDGDSSDSPIEDWEELYSSDDMTRKPRLTPAGPPQSKESLYESEDEGLPDPWNAVCIVGVRVYSMDEDLELRVVMEGGEFLEGGMGRKGEADLDNAQANAGGERGKKNADNKEEDGFAPYPTIVKTGGEDFEKVEVDKKQEPKKEEPKEQTPNEEEAPKEDAKDSAADDKKDRKDDSMEDFKSEKSSDSNEYDHLDSGASTPGILVTPEPTPLESSKELC